jgi:peptide/nickel transport system substrate-binding protein
MRSKLAVLSVLLLALMMTLGMAQAQDFAPMSQAAPDCEYGGTIQSIEAVDELTVRFTLCAPDPAFAAKVAFSAMGIYSQEQIEGAGATQAGDLVNAPVGTGPYMLSNWDRTNEIVLVRNPNYWGEPAVEETAIIRWNAESSARALQLQSGEVDGIDNVGTADFAAIEADSSLALYPREGLNVFYIGMNNTIAPFDDLRIRQAVALAIDKQRIVDSYYPPGSIIATQFMPPAMFGHTPEADALALDLDAARALVEEYAAETGATLPLEVTLSYRNVVRGYLPEPDIVGTDIQSQLAEIGINVTVAEVESTTFLDSVTAGTQPFYLLGWGADYIDPTNFLDFHFGAASIRFGDPIPEVVDLLTQAGQIANQDERYPLYQEANTILRDQAVMVPVAHGGSAVAFQADIAGAHSSPVSNEQLYVMEDPNDDDIVWVQNGEPGGLYCADETDGESLRVCEQINEGLLGFATGTADVVNVLAEDYESNEDATVWTFTLRSGVLFSDGSTLDANDVVTSFVVQWDAAHPSHLGRTGTFEYFAAFFGTPLNAPPPAP